MANNRMFLCAVDKDGKMRDVCMIAKHYDGAWYPFLSIKNLADFFFNAFLNKWGIGITDEYSDRPLPVVYHYNGKAWLNPEERAKLEAVYGDKWNEPYDWEYDMKREHTSPYPLPKEDELQDFVSLHRLLAADAIDNIQLLESAVENLLSLDVARTPEKRKRIRKKVSNILEDYFSRADLVDRVRAVAEAGMKEDE